MFLLLSSTDIIIAALLLFLTVFGGMYAFYKMIRYAVKNAIKESAEK